MLSDVVISMMPISISKYNHLVDDTTNVNNVALLSPISDNLSMLVVHVHVVLLGLARKIVSQHIDVPK